MEIELIALDRCMGKSVALFKRGQELTVQGNVLPQQIVWIIGSGYRNISLFKGYACQWPGATLYHFTHEEGLDNALRGRSDVHLLVDDVDHMKEGVFELLPYTPHCASITATYTPSAEPSLKWADQAGKPPYRDPSQPRHGLRTGPLWSGNRR